MESLRVLVTIAVFLVFADGGLLVAGSGLADRDCVEMVFELERGVDFDGGEFFDGFREVMAVKGRVFVGCYRENFVLIFDEFGKRIGKFGRKGLGPGDLYFPHRLSVLDGQYVLVGEYALNRRVSVFDLNGKFMKIVKTKWAAFSPVALRDNIFAYVAKRDGGKGKVSSGTDVVMIKDIDTGAEEVIEEFSVVHRGDVVMPDGSIFKVGNFGGELFIARGYRGALVFGNSGEKTLHFYDLETKNEQTIELRLGKKDVTDDYIACFKNDYLKRFKERSPKNHSVYKTVESKLRKASFREFFDDHLPYYSNIIVNANGEIILVEGSDDSDGGAMKALIISPEGKSQTGARIRIEGFRWPENNHFKRVALIGDIGYILENKQDEPDLFTLRKFRVKTTAAACY